MKKSQITGEIFIYILLIVVVGVILLLGYNYFTKLSTKKCELETATFISTLIDFSKRYNEFGAVEKRQLQAPCDYERVCFVDAEAIRTKTLPTPPPPISPIIANSVTSGIEQNIFLIKKAVVTPAGYSAKIKVINGGICIDRTANQFRISFSGDGEQTALANFTTP